MRLFVTFVGKMRVFGRIDRLGENGFGGGRDLVIQGVAGLGLASTTALRIDEGEELSRDLNEYVDTFTPPR